MKKGGSFLIEETAPEEVFTPEDFSEEQMMIRDMTGQFVEEEVLPQTEKIEHKEWDVTVRLLRCPTAATAASAHCRSFTSVPKNTSANICRRSARPKKFPLTPYPNPAAARTRWRQRRMPSAAPAALTGSSTAKRCGSRIRPSPTY